MNIQDIYSLMKELYDNENNPKIGIFWYLPEENDLFGVNSIIMLEDDYKKSRFTLSTSHKTYWQRQEHKAIAKGDRDSIFLQDYTQIPRGIVAYQNGRFIAIVGSWYKDYEDDLRGLITFEFNLTDFEFEIGEYLELGDSWDEK